MFQYYFFLGIRSLRRNPALTALMVLILAVGVAASVSTLTILHVMSGNPIPSKSERLFVPVIDNRPLVLKGAVNETNIAQLSYRDALNLLKSKQGERRTAVFGIDAVVEQGRKEIDLLEPNGIAVTRDFFAMFDAPFRFGQAWNISDDNAGADVIVLARSLAEKLFGKANPVGQNMIMNDVNYQVVGVLEDWKPVPRFYRPEDPFGDADEVMIPISSAIRHQTEHRGNTSCKSAPAPGYQGFLDSECTWIHVWFETKSAAKRADLLNYLDAYTTEQTKFGRLPRHAKTQLWDVMEWLEHRHLVDSDSKLSAWLAFGFLALCLVNTTGLLLAKFSARASDISIRRALGASRREIFLQFLLETTVVGIVGGALGLSLSFGAMALIAIQSENIAAVAHMDATMLIMSFMLSLLATLLAGLLPIWRACQVAPALQLKSH